MQKIFDEVGSLDKRCYDEYFLSEDILMEHAAEGMANFIFGRFKRGASVIVVCGSGNNGADGIALARLLHNKYDVSIFYAKEPKSPMAVLQQKRANAIGVRVAGDISECDVLLDAVVGTGFRGEFDAKISKIIKQMNTIESYKIACDVPSGYCFYADTTLTMGGLKKDFYLDSHKECMGDIEVVDLGISREIYESGKSTSWYLLDFEDMKLPYRVKKDSHKGSFGHLALACGEKVGASVLSAKAALRFGSGLVTLVGFENVNIPYTIMYSHILPKNTTALCCGMGLGSGFSDIELKKFLDNELPLVCDADLFYMSVLKDILKRQNVVLTPHPKEFTALLRQSGIADIGVEMLQKNRFEYIEKFSKKFPHITVVLKGANVIIANDGEFFINPYGSEVLAKGGSGDILSGLIGALLSQGYNPLEAAKTASLAHAKLGNNYTGVDFSLIPDDLIEGISKL